jgi:PAS domain S-box-containing protein
VTAAPFEARRAVVLAVDDSPLDLELAVDHLSSRGLEVHTAVDGEQAIEKAGLLHPDLILLDVMMPKMSGFETCRRLKLLTDLRDTPVIFVTDLSDPENKVRGFEAGGVDFVTKPIEANELCARVDTQLRLHAMRNELVARNLQLHTEIAQRTELAEALEAQRAFLQQVIDMIPQSVCVKTADNRVALANRAMADLAQTTVQALLGGPGPGISHSLMAETRERSDPALAMPQPDRERIIEEETFVDPSGQAHILHTVLRPLQNRGGNATQLLIVSTDITQRKRVERELEGYRQGLENLVASRTAELQQRNRDLDIEVAERRRLQSAFLETVDNERRHLAQELHDGVGQDLVGAAFMLDGAMSDLRAGRPVTTAHLERMTLAIRNAIKVARDIAHGLAPLSDTTGGLLEALHALRDRMGGPPGPQIDLDADPLAIDAVSRRACDQLYRIAQEAASNAMKHARADRITIRLRIVGDMVRLEIIDDGRGISAGRPAMAGLGLHTMRDRAVSIGATLQLLPGEGRGTIVTCELRRGDYTQFSKTAT